MRKSFIYSFNTQKPVDSIPVNRPCCVMFGGYKTLKPLITRHDLQQFDQFAKSNKLESDLYGIVYTMPTDGYNLCPNFIKPHTKRVIKERALLVTHFVTPYVFRNYVKDIFDIVIKPRIQSDQNVKLPLDIAQQNLRNMTVIAHCYGVYVADYLNQLTTSSLQELNYTPDEIASIKKQLVMITLSPSYPLCCQDSTVINFASAADKTVPYSNMFPNIFTTTFIPNFNMVITPKVFRDTGSSKNNSYKDKEHRIWPLTYSQNLTEQGYDIINSLRTVLLNAMKPEIITDKQQLFKSNDPYFSLEHAHVNADPDKSMKKHVVTNAIKNFISRFK